jgi:hypothetical protein
MPKSQRAIVARERFVVLERALFDISELAESPHTWSW